MWRTVLIVTVPCMVKGLLLPLSTGPSQISNLQLLIPYPAPESNERADASVESTENQSRDHDEPYSSIPAYAFSLDTDAAADVPRKNSDSTYGPELVPVRSIYLNNVFKHSQDRLLRGYKRNDLLEDKRKGCESLARQHSADARDVLIFLCTELVNVLSASCGCSEKKNYAKEVKSSSTYGVPWFGQSSSRRHTSAEYVPDEPPRNEIFV